MINQTFGIYRDNLMTIWSRENLGLTPEQFHAKTKTKKNLQKIWDEKPRFSGLNTILLDDSPSKATNQPANLLCLPEYDSYTHKKDLDRLLKNHSRPSDKALLAVIGILDTLSQGGHEVPQWHHDKGLYKFSEVSQEADAESPEGQQWFLDESNLKGWIEEGREVLKRLEIPEEHGLVVEQRPEGTGKRQRRKNRMIATPATN
jgi:hypothetical protein